MWLDNETKTFNQPEMIRHKSFSMQTMNPKPNCNVVLTLFHTRGVSSLLQNGGNVRFETSRKGGILGREKDARPLPV